MKNEYIGIYDHKESDTFRPTIDRRIHIKSPISKALTCREDSCTIIEINGGNRIMDELEQKIIDSLESTSLEVKEVEKIKQTGLRIRKLTPCECIRLMGFEDKDYQAMVDSGLSDSAIYHCAGDSIVSPVLVSIFSRMISEDPKLGENTIKEYVEKNVASWKKV